MLIKTPRLTIRPITRDDTFSIHEYASDKSITMMLFLPNETITETENFVNYAVNEWNKPDPDDREFVIVFQNKIIGGINLEKTDPAGKYEIGWTIHPDYRNKGFATEAAKALLKYAFENLSAQSITAHCDSENKASESVMKKIGMDLISAAGTRIYPKTGKVSGELMYTIES